MNGGRTTEEEMKKEEAPSTRRWQTSQEEAMNAEATGQVTPEELDYGQANEFQEEALSQLHAKQQD